MSRAQSDIFQKTGKHDPVLQRRIDALRLRVKAEKKKKKGKKKSSQLKIPTSTPT